MEIRVATPDEFDQARAVMLRAYEEYAGWQGPETWARYSTDIQDIEARMAFSDLIVGIEGDAVVGAVTYYRADSGGGYGDLWPAGWPSIRLLAVPPEHRGHGFGRLLTQACIDRARSQSTPGIALGTTEKMALARALYERMGFVHHPQYDFEPAAGILVYVYLLEF